MFQKLKKQFQQIHRHAEVFLYRAHRKAKTDGKASNWFCASPFWVLIDRYLVSAPRPILCSILANTLVRFNSRPIYVTVKSGRYSRDKRVVSEPMSRRNGNAVGGS